MLCYFCVDFRICIEQDAQKKCVGFIGLVWYAG